MHPWCMRSCTTRVDTGFSCTAAHEFEHRCSAGTPQKSKKKATYAAAPQQQLEPTSCDRLRRIDRIHIPACFEQYISANYALVLASSDHKAVLLTLTPTLPSATKRKRCPTSLQGLFGPDVYPTPARTDPFGALQGPHGTHPSYMGV